MIGNAEEMDIKYEGNGTWAYFTGIQGIAGYPVYRADLVNLTFGVGGNKKWIPGIGIGGSIVAKAGLWENITKREIVDTISSNGLDIIEIDTINNRLNAFVPYLRLMVPLSDIRKADIVGTYYPQVFHLFLSGCAWKPGTGWGDKYLLLGGGLDFCIPIEGPPITFGIEAGYLQSWQGQNNTEDFYIGLKLGISGWIPPNIKKRETQYKYMTIARNDLFSIDIDTYKKVYNPGETVELSIEIMNYSSKQIVESTILYLGGSLAKYLSDRSFIIPTINEISMEILLKNFRLKEQIPSGKYTLKVEGVKNSNEISINIMKESKDYVSTYETDIKLNWPTKLHEISSPFGPRYPGPKREFHKGIDIPVPIGTPIMAAASGRVIFKGWKRDFGYCILLKHSSSFETFYGHLQKILVKKGTWVNKGDIIGKSGNTGRRCEGPHLHFEVRLNGKPVNPEEYLP